MLRLFCIFLLFSLSLPFIFAGNIPNDTLYLKITTSDKEKVADDIVLNIESENITFSVNGQGYVYLTTLPPDEYTLEIKHKGYRNKIQKIEKKHFDRKDTIKVELVPNWVFDGSESLSFSQHAYSDYWQKGGTNSYAVRGEVNLGAKYKKNRIDWENAFIIKHGMLKQGENEFLKSEDLVEMNSEFGRKFNEHFLLTALVNAKTQIRKGFKIEKDGSRGELRSDFLAPGYFNFGTGMDYKHKGLGLSVYYSPVNSKITLVRDSTLSQFYLPKELAGNTNRYELGSYLKINYQKEIMKNIVFQTKADFFANHLKDFGSVDVNWETKMAFKVNKYVSANILTHLIYDEDILFDIVEPGTDPGSDGRKGPRTQFHEALNIGLTHKF